MQNNPLLPVSEARENMLKNISSLSSEKCSIEQAHNRIIAQDLTALLSHPAEAVSSMDGYAARISDIVDVPVTLPQVGISSAGHIYNKPLLSGQLVRIFTGAVIPDGCDTIILQEDTKISQDGIEINERPRLGQYIRASGLDFSAGEKIISKSSKLTARECALIALAGYHEVPVIKQPEKVLINVNLKLRKVEPYPVWAYERLIKIKKTHEKASFPDVLGKKISLKK